jgi:hypothetical protein
MKIINHYLFLSIAPIFKSLTVLQRQDSLVKQNSDRKDLAQTSPIIENPIPLQKM